MQSLPVLEKIEELRLQGAFPPEEAELLRRKVVQGVEGFISAGLSMPELGDRAVYNPRLLLAPQPKQLTSSTAGDPSGETKEPEEDRLSAEERETFRRLKKKAEGEAT